MEIGVIIEGILEGTIAKQPWIYYKDTLAEKDINIIVYQGNDEAFKRPFDAMLLHVWQDWGSKKLFHSSRILPIMEKYAIYRAEFPETVQIILNHTDMSRRPYATSYWRPGDPILYRTPAYNREELYPFPADQIWAYETVWGDSCYVPNALSKRESSIIWRARIWTSEHILGGPCLASNTPPKYKAGFIGGMTGPPGYRQSVAKETARVGIGICKTMGPYSKERYNGIMANCQIIVCPRGWGEQSRRHWDAWLSGKPVLTDRECDAVEMIPGLRLQEGVHYLMFDDPKEIPDIVSDWTRPSHLDDLAQIAENGRRAALSYDACGRIIEFFKRVVKTKNTL